MVTRIHSGGKFCYYVHTNDHNLKPMFFLTMSWNNLWMVTWIHSVCKLCYYNHTNNHNVKPTFFPTMPWNTTCVWWSRRQVMLFLWTSIIIIWYPYCFWLYLGTQLVDGRIHSACKLCYQYFVHTNLRPILYTLKHNLWMVTWIHSGGKLRLFVCTNDHNLKPMFFPTTPWNTIIYLWMVTWIHSDCKLCYNVHTNNETHVLSNYPLKHKLVDLTWTYSGGKLYYVHTNDYNLRPLFFPTIS